MEGERYASVTAARSLSAAPQTGGETSTPPNKMPITEQTVRDLTDDELFHLLNEYARRVVEEEGTELKLPVKVSFVPILRRKLEHRCAVGEAEPTLKEEANALAAWIKGKVRGHHIPTPSTIERQLADTYRAAKRASKPDIR